MKEYILEAKGVEFSYPDGTKALKDINIGIEKGKKVAVLGSNGAGKSTLFLHFNGILKPTKGSIRYNGKDISYKHKHLMELRKNVGIVFQDPDTQLFSASVLQEISFGPLNLGLSKEEVLKRVNEAMRAAEIVDLKDKPTHFLSYGQKKRVSIADILAMEPEVIIFDEPTAWLDPKLSLQIMELFNKLNKDGITVVLSTHDIDLAYSWADYIIVMEQGQVVEEGFPESIFLNEELLHNSGLERPFIIEMYLELVRKGWLTANKPVPRTKEELFALLVTKAPEAV
ncbi:energy-coupling factor ABC transporter ATP-binding protein [Desulfolucanica intricata]|uniref:energy-coupling factor ABC transporter ATP-binding protein n=1 Tax=Desulfolucanica intricata TaxID=1285191 RepID=UPI000829A8F0|nr:ATP-binding cassette domain-containing protein [Desulfolucanica intricata]